MYKPWISPHNKIVAMFDDKNNVVELVEDHARGTCIGGSAWSLYHYTKNSPCIFWSKREGTRIFYKIKPSIFQSTTLKPSYSPASIDFVIVENDKIKVSYSGLAGAGVAALGRTMAKGVENVEIIERGGGERLGRVIITLPKKEKIIIGVDDTDRKDEGATWSLVNEISYRISLEMDVDYLEHSIVQLYPRNPYKTQNCVAISVSFAASPNKKAKLINNFEEMLRDFSLSDYTGMAIFEGIIFNERLMNYAKKAKTSMIEIQETYEVASQCDVILLKVKGERGLIGALAAIPYVENPDEAVRLSDERCL